MLAPLVFMLTLSGILLLVVGERMGLSADIGAKVAHLLLVLAVVALGVGSVTSRFERFAAGSRTGRERMGRLAVRLASLIVLVLAFSPRVENGLFLWGSFAAGFLLAHLGQGAPEASIGGRMARVLAAGAMVILLVAVLPALADTLARLSGLPLSTAQVVLGGMALVVLLPGGASGIGVVQGVVLALVLVLGLAPLVVLIGLASMERGDPLTLETLLHFSRPQWGSLTLAPLPVGALLGVAAGLAGRGQGQMKLVPALGGLIAGVLLAALLVGMHVFAQDWLTRIVGARILSVPPQQWPAFVFDEEVRGWLRACGQIVQDPLAAARACRLATPTVVLRMQDLTFMSPQASAALARAAGLPLTLGNLWLLMPVMIGLAGVLSVLHAVALALSETILFRTFNPTGLRSWRLAMARLVMLATSVAAAIWAVTGVPQPPEPIIGIAAGLALVGWGWARLQPAPERP